MEVTGSGRQNSQHFQELFFPFSRDEGVLWLHQSLWCCCAELSVPAYVLETQISAIWAKCHEISGDWGVLHHIQSLTEHPEPHEASRASQSTEHAAINNHELLCGWGEARSRGCTAGLGREQGAGTVNPTPEVSLQWHEGPARGCPRE